MSGAPGIALTALAGASLATILIAVHASGSWATLTVIFAIFHMIYGVSGPVAVLMGSTLPDAFGTPYHLDTYLAEYGLATFGFGAGLILASRSGMVRPDAPAAVPRSPSSVRTGVLFVAIGSVFEFINYARAGGWAIVIQGKAVYQSAVDALVLTLPSSAMVSLGLALLTLSASRAAAQGLRPIRRGDALLALLAIAPSLALTIVLGYRAPLLQWLLVVVVGAFYYTPVRSLGWRMLGLTSVIYLGSGLLYANRAILAYGLMTGEWQQVWETAQTSERLVLAINPAATEFGAAFGNFSEYVARTNEEPRLGSSYVRAFTLPIPGFLYPGKKPQQIGYEFRDKYFAALAQQGSIAGTAYSSLLEAYVNFGWPGGAGVYFALALLLALAERTRRASNSIGWQLGYVLLVSDAVSFHRSDFSFLVGNLALNAVVIVLYLAGSTSLAWIWSSLRADRVAPARYS